MLKKILNLKDAQKLSKNDQETIHGGRAGSSCEVGCQGLSAGDYCYSSANCECFGRCGNNGVCNPF